MTDILPPNSPGEQLMCDTFLYEARKIVSEEIAQSQMLKFLQSYRNKDYPNKDMNALIDHHLNLIK